MADAKIGNELRCPHGAGALWGACEWGGKREQNSTTKISYTLVIKEAGWQRKLEQDRADKIESLLWQGVKVGPVYRAGGRGA